MPDDIEASGSKAIKIQVFYEGYRDAFKGSFGVKDVESRKKFTVESFYSWVITSGSDTIKILNHLKDCPFITELRGAIINDLRETVWLTYDFFLRSPNQSYFMSLSTDQIRNCLYQIISGLQVCQGRGIIHRNIRLKNLVLDYATMRIRISGWEYAVFSHDAAAIAKDDVPLSAYMSPERLLRSKKYDYAVDMWSVGCILGGLIFHKQYIFKGDSRGARLLDIEKHLGSRNILNFVKKYDLDFDQEDRNIPRIDWKDLITPENANTATDEAIDLLKNLLFADPAHRLTADAAMEHPYLSRTPIPNISRSEYEGWLSDVELDDPEGDQQDHQINQLFNSEFKIDHKIGAGSYGIVYKMINVKCDEIFAVKYLEGKYEQIARKEIGILEKLRGCPNVIQLKGVFFGSPQTCLVLEYIDYSISYFGGLKPEDIPYYFYQLLVALEACHSRRIIHRDLKPDNVLINLETRQLRLIDFGLAEYYEEGELFQTAEGAVRFMAPEILLQYEKFDFAVDMWAFGLIFASSVFHVNRVFFKRSRPALLLEITDVLGSEKFFEYVKKYNIEIRFGNVEQFQNHEGKGWSSLISNENRHTATDDAVDLISKLLIFDHGFRLTAKEAMEHPYFRTIHQSILIKSETT